MYQNGFIPLRRGLKAHVESGELSPNEFCAYVLILMDCDAGVWLGSGAKLDSLMGRAVSVRTAQRILQDLSDKKYIRALGDISERNNHPYLVDKYEVREGGNSWRLDAAGTKDWKNPVYVLFLTSGHNHDTVATPGVAHMPKSGPEMARIVEGERKKEKDIQSGEVGLDVPSKPKSKATPTTTTRRVDPEALLTDASKEYRLHARGESWECTDFGRPSKDQREQWERLVREHGGDVVLRAVEIWVKEQSRMKKGSCPIAFWLKRADEYIEEAKKADSEIDADYPDIRKQPEY
jgi:hypothetical protein